VHVVPRQRIACYSPSSETPNAVAGNVLHQAELFSKQNRWLALRP